MDWSKYAPFFQSTEFDCKCGCGLNNMRESHMDMLLKARKRAKIPFVITSGSRCLAHNAKEGGSLTSDHLSGSGSDIQAISGRQKWIIEEALLAVGFTRLGRGRSFIHAGNDPDNVSHVLWAYSY